LTLALQFHACKFRSFFHNTPKEDFQLIGSHRSLKKGVMALVSCLHWYPAASQRVKMMFQRERKRRALCTNPVFPVRHSAS